MKLQGNEYLQLFQSPRVTNLLISTIESSRQKFVKTYIQNTVRWFFSIRLQEGMWNQSCDLSNKGYHAKNSLPKRNGKDFILLSCLKGRKRLTGNGVAFETSKSTPNDTPPPIRTHLLIFFKQFHWQRTKYSNIWAHGIHSHSNQNN